MKLTVCKWTMSNVASMSKGLWLNFTAVSVWRHAKGLWHWLSQPSTGFAGFCWICMYHKDLFVVYALVIDMSRESTGLHVQISLMQLIKTAVLQSIVISIESWCFQFDWEAKHQSMKLYGDYLSRIKILQKIIH